jgi:hypothetical protein
VPDAITGATPDGDFDLLAFAGPEASGKFRLLLEINQSWDWNEYWTNDLYPENADYKTSSQPAVVYEAVIDPDAEDAVFEMKIAGHSHYAGEDGELYEDITSLTTATEIVGTVRVKIVDMEGE